MRYKTLQLKLHQQQHYINIHSPYAS